MLRAACNVLRVCRAHQMIWVWSVSLPVTFLNSTEVNPALDARDVVGLVMFMVGFYFECVGDIQKDIFKVR